MGSPAADPADFFRFDGHNIAFWSAGEGRPLLLVHGYPTSSWDWHRIWDALAEKRRVVACDMLGFGLSDKPKSGYSIHRQTDLQQALLDHLGVDAFDAVVHDYGDTVVMQLFADTTATGYVSSFFSVAIQFGARWHESASRTADRMARISGGVATAASPFLDPYGRMDFEVGEEDGTPNYMKAVVITSYQSLSGITATSGTTRRHPQTRRRSYLRAAHTPR